MCSVNFTRYTQLIKDSIHKASEYRWLFDIQSSPKLRTYILIKDKLTLEQYLTHQDDNHSSKQLKQSRAWLTQLRVGTNMLAIDQQRPIKELQPLERICIACDQNVIEDESHFILHCQHYQHHRTQLYNDTASITNNHIQLQSVSNRMKLKYMLGDITQLSHPTVTIQSQQIHLIKVFIGNIITMRKNLFDQNHESSQSDNDDNYSQHSNSSSAETEIIESSQ